MLETNAFSVAILVFGVLVLGGEVYVLTRPHPTMGTQGFGPQGVRIFGITIVVVVASALAASNVPSDRTAVAIGLLGTIAGYLAGRTESKTE